MNRPSEYWRGLPLILRFLIVGGYNTAFGYLAFTALYLAVAGRIHYLIVGLMAHAVAVVNAFVVYRLFVFGCERRWLPSFWRFNLSQLVSLGFGIVGLYLFVQFGHIPPLLAQLIVTLASVMLSYALHRYFSFRTTGMPP